MMEPDGRGSSGHATCARGSPVVQVGHVLWRYALPLAAASLLVFKRTCGAPAKSVAHPHAASRAVLMLKSD